jgi:hypothetical protein
MCRVLLDRYSKPFPSLKSSDEKHFKWKHASALSLSILIGMRSARGQHSLTWNAVCFETPAVVFATRFA